MQLLGLQKDDIQNPFNVSLSQDSVYPVVKNIVNYNETAFLSTWNPIDNVGVFIHLGRCRQDLDLWYAQTVAYLPGGELAVDRSWGRSCQPNEVRTGNFSLTMGQRLGHWYCQYDGAAEICDAKTMAGRPSGSGVARPMSWKFSTESAAPIWDMYHGQERANQQDWAKGSHIQQIVRTSGTLVVNGKTYSLDGVGGKDHSSGVRDMTGFGGHSWLTAALPGSALHCISVKGCDGSTLLNTGVEFSANGYTTAHLEGALDLTRLDWHEEELELVIKRSSGKDERLHCDLLHYFPLCLGMDNDNINGVEWDGPDLLVMTEARLRITRLSDGAVGYAHLERGARRSSLAAGVKSLP